MASASGQMAEDRDAWSRPAAPEALALKPRALKSGQVEGLAECPVCFRALCPDALVEKTFILPHFTSYFTC